MRKPIVRKTFECKEEVNMGPEPKTVGEFCRELMALETNLIQRGFTEVSVEMDSGGEYDSRYDFLVLTGRRHETDEELAQREADSKARHEKIMLAAQKRKESIAKENEERKAAGLPPVGMVKCGLDKCGNIYSKRNVCCPKCGFTQGGVAKFIRSET